MQRYIDFLIIGCARLDQCRPLEKGFQTLVSKYQVDPVVERWHRNYYYTHLARGRKRCTCIHPWVRTEKVVDAEKTETFMHQPTLKTFSKLQHGLFQKNSNMDKRYPGLLVVNSVNR